MTSLFKWIAVHVLKNKLGYGRSWQTFSPVESDISSRIFTWLQHQKMVI